MHLLDKKDVKYVWWIVKFNSNLKSKKKNQKSIRKIQRKSRISKEYLLFN